MDNTNRERLCQGLEPIIEQAIFAIQQRRKQQAIKAGLTGLEVTMFMLLAAPGELLEPSPAPQSSSEAD